MFLKKVSTFVKLGLTRPILHLSVHQKSWILLCAIEKRERKNEMEKVLI